MDEMKSLDVLSKVLSDAREEFAVLASWDLLGTTEGERQLYFARYSLLKELILSIESFLNEDKRLRQLEMQVRSTI